MMRPLRVVATPDEAATPAPTPAPTTTAPPATVPPARNCTVVPVLVGNAAFIPDNVVVMVGDTLRFTWAGVALHFVSSSHTSDACRPNGGFSSGAAVAGPRTFDVPVMPATGFTHDGVFPFYCGVHCLLGMRGVVQVAGTCTGYTPPALDLTRDVACQGLDVPFVKEVGDALATDCWALDMCVTRGSVGGLYNSVLETAHAAGVTPEGVLFARGPVSSRTSLTFLSADQWLGADPAALVGVRSTAWLLSVNMFVEVELSAWGAGGELAWRRAAVSAATCQAVSPAPAPPSSAAPTTTTAPPTTAPVARSGLSGGEIAAIVVLCGLAAGAVAVGVGLLLRRRHNREAGADASSRELNDLS